MRKCVLVCIAIVLFSAVSRGQGSYGDRAKKYIDQYSAFAMEEQKLSGVPAAITLGQGILETEAGASELMTLANNHFGIKCGKYWEGPTFSHDDDAPNECFKKYSCAAASYHDHSEHLKKNPRYAPLFSISQTDYASWAVCLRKCGYATNPQYAQQLIKIIEDYNLQQYTYAALYNKSPIGDPERTRLDAKNESEESAGNDDTAKIELTAARVDPIKRIADSAQNFMARLQNAEQERQDSLANAQANNFQNSRLITVNGLKAFYAYKGEMLLQYAMKFNVRYPKLLEVNDLPDAPMPFNGYVYVEKKLANGTHTQHAVKSGESMAMISQVEGVQLKRLETLNLMTPGEEPAPGVLLQLQFPARNKAALASNTPQSGAVATPPVQPVAVGRSTPAETPAPSTPIVTTGKKLIAVSEPIAAAPPATGKKGLARQAGVEGNDTLEDTEEEVLDTEPIRTQEVTEVKPVPKPEKITKSVPQSTSYDADDRMGKYYTVKKGDTAFSIAKRNNIPLDQLLQWNGLNDGGIQVGQTLRVRE